MSFGLLKHFKNKKDETSNRVDSIHYRHVILGQDLGAILKLLELRKSAQGESIRLVSSRPLNRQLLIENYGYGVSTLRSAMAVENIYKKYYEARISPQSKEASFYKDGKFHDFGGRAKSMELQKGEDFYTNKGYRLDLQSLFTNEEWENLDGILNEHLEIRIFQAIEKTVPDELMDKKEWLLTFKDFTKMTCENLYVSLSPKKFIHYMVNREQLTPDLIEICTSVNVQAAVSVTWRLAKEIYPEERTLFVPQSMTHEWGHFIVEFEGFDFTKKEQMVHVLFLINEEEPQSEDLAQKIKLMKRVLDRIFPDMEKHIKQEYIRFDEEMFLSEIKDAAIEQIGFDYPTLHFIGQMKPMPESLSHEKFLSRVLL